MLLDILGFCFDMLVEVVFDYGISRVYQAASRQTSLNKEIYALSA